MWWSMSEPNLEVQVFVHGSVTVEIPALSALVEYLREQQRQQAEINNLAASVQRSAEGLRQSQEALKGAVEEGK